jgi:uncharacterized membrane protein
MEKYIFSYIIATLSFFAIDMVWLGLIARNFYRNQIGHLMADDVNWPAAIIFYLLFILGIVIFAVSPALDTGKLSTALIYGALFGFFTYATYDLTNLATLKDWPMLMVVIDIAWGTFLSAAVASITYLTVTNVLN